MYPEKTYGQLWSDIAHCYSLKDGWDQDGKAAAPTPACCELAVNILDVLDGCGMLPSEVGPDASEGITFTYEFKHHSVDVCVRNTGTILLADGPDVRTIRIDELSRAISRLCIDYSHG